MALRMALPRLARARARALSSLRNSCDGAPAPPCAPCQPAPRPPCRARAPERARATRHVCCPPPQGCAPPCPPPPCSTTLDCSNSSQAPKTLIPNASAACGGDRDGVALRLALAERARQRDYEREVSARATRREPPPPEPYSLGAERECCRATDGRKYVLPCQPAPPLRCGPGRAPPPAQCVEILHDDGCTIRDRDRVDPCAHLPRTLLHVDRAAPADRTACAAHPRPPSPAKNLTSRIMETLSLKKTAANSCPRAPCESKCRTTGAKRAGDTGWCETLPTPPAVAAPCREPTPMEKLKPRGPGRCSGKQEPGKRCFHSSATDRTSTSCKNPKDNRDSTTTASLSKAKSEMEKLDKVLKEREALQEAGRGRVAAGGACKSSSKAAAGSLDMPVPAGAASVRVRVSLEGARDAGCACAAAAAAGPCAGDTPAGVSGKRESWLSIKSLHKKLTTCRKIDMAKVEKKSTACLQAEATKPNPPQSPCTPPARPPPAPCAPLKQPIPPPCPPPKPPASAPCKPKLPTPAPCKPKQPTPAPCKPKQPTPAPCKPKQQSPAPCKPKPPPNKVNRFSSTDDDARVYNNNDIMTC